MCGFAGIVKFDGRLQSPDIALRMVKVLKHRGPDMIDAVAMGPASLGHARLSVIDLSPTGRQPMTTSDNRFTIVYNGEVYNYRELKVELELRGERFMGKSDTEVVLKAFARWGKDCLKRLNGVFSFAVWDKLDGKLHLVRDRFGVKPLYYRLEQDGGITFGSEVKAILESNSSQEVLDYQSLHEFIHYGTGGFGSHTMLGKIRKLEAGQYLELDSDGFQIEHYWRLDLDMEQGELMPNPHVHIRSLLEAAVKRQLVSDVPVGVFLSGGIDSSAVVAFASRHYGDSLKTYSVGFDFAGDTNELAKAAAVAKYYGTDHHELFIQGVDLPNIIEALIGSHDDPFSDAANIPLYLLCKELDGKVPVVLQGDGGDELFGGYRRYYLLARERLFRVLTSLGPMVNFMPVSNGNKRRLNRWIKIFRETDPNVRMALMLAQNEVNSSALKVLGKDVRAKMQTSDPVVRYREIGGRLSEIDPVQRMLWTDMQIILPDIFLEKVDKSTMAWGVESRVPFLDHELVDYVLGLPSKLKVSKGMPKGLLKTALRGVVPDFVLDAPKMGFGVPYSRWLAGPLEGYARERICDGRAVQDGLIDATHVNNLFYDHVQSVDDHGFLLWKTLNLALWYERYRPQLGC